jgi:hypothetical protein
MRWNDSVWKVRSSKDLRRSDPRAEIAAPS